jgi:NAD(P)-dependent dehydrogenase (short-subunit alcohol dehydrogenase family)
MLFFYQILAVVVAAIGYLLFTTPVGISEVEFLNKNELASTIVPIRLFRSLFLQTRYNPVCSYTKDQLLNQLILVTGGNKGIGYEIVVQLVQRGAHVVIAGRDEKSMQQSMEKIKIEISKSHSQGSVEYVVLDLSDISTIPIGVQQLSSLKYNNQPFDQIIFNAGIVPTSALQTSKQNYELAFATNALGHHVLFKSLLQYQLIKEKAKILLVTGDIYITINDCTHDYKTSDGGEAYARSKLCINWLFLEYKEKYNLLYDFYLIHPGVATTDLAIAASPPLLLPFFMNSTLASQTILIVSTHTSNALIPGSYYHNTYGRMILQPTDVAMNRTRSAETWELVERISEAYVH